MAPGVMGKVFSVLKLRHSVSALEQDTEYAVVDGLWWGENRMRSQSQCLK